MIGGPISHEEVLLVREDKLEFGKLHWEFLEDGVEWEDKIACQIVCSLDLCCTTRPREARFTSSSNPDGEISSYDAANVESTHRTSDKWTVMQTRATFMESPNYASLPKKLNAHSKPGQLVEIELRVVRLATETMPTWCRKRPHGSLGARMRIVRHDTEENSRCPSKGPSMS